MFGMKNRLGMYEMTLRLGCDSPTTPMLFSNISVNQMFPSPPGAIPCAPAPGVGIGISLMLPDVVTRPTLLAVTSDSVNHSAPSGPGVMTAGRLLGVGTGNVPVTVPPVV